MNDVVINKIQSMQRAVHRAREIYRSDRDGFETNDMRQDAAIFNVLRACEQAIDLANHVIKTQKVGILTSSAESFDLLQRESIIEKELAERLKKMTHFRNSVIHQYQQINLDIVKTVISAGLDDLIEFGDHIIHFARCPQ